MITNTIYKNKTNTLVDAASETKLAVVNSDISKLTFDNSVARKLKVNVSAGSVGIKKVSSTTISPATQATLATIKTATDGLTFDTAEGGLKASGTAPALASSVNIKDKTTANTNIASAEKITLLRRMVKLMESQATVDSTNSQRISVDGFGAVVTGIGPSGDGIPLVTMASDMVATIPGVSTPTFYVGWNDQRFQDIARDAYARGIRKNLRFT